MKTKAAYTCPMHKEIQEEIPGTCPKCGMKLIEKKIKIDEEKMSF